jgi:hypothetical protein
MGVHFGPVSQYVTDFHRDEVLEFLDTVGSTPFFILLSTEAPHWPATPAAGDELLYSDYLYRDRGYGETDLSDKPEWVADPDIVAWAKDPFRWNPAGNDEFYRNQLRSLQAVDRAVGAIVNKLDALGMLDKTIIVFTSDNGFQWGEHGLHEKAMPYDEVIRVPLIMAMPGISPRTEDHLIAADLDLPATMLELAGINKPSDGNSLADLLRNPGADWQDEMLLQNWGYRAGVFGVWASLRTDQWKFVEYPTGETELYNLTNDPYELNSLHDHIDYQSTLGNLKNRLDDKKGLAISNFALPAGNVGQEYSAQVHAWGGNEPYRWTVVGQTSVFTCMEKRPVLSPFELQNIPGCTGGDPPYDAGTVAGLFLWKDDDNSWHLRGTAAGGTATYRGRLVADQAFVSVTGVSIEPDDILDTSIGNIISFEFNAGGAGEVGTDFTIPEGAYVSMIIEERLPPGLVLQPLSGDITGTPTQTGTFNVNVMVEDSSIASYTGLPQRYIVPYILKIN